MGTEQVTFWRDPALANMEVLKATYIHHAFSRHTHEGYAIGVIETGVEAFDYLGSGHQAPAGSLVIIHPEEVHTGQAAVAEGWQYRMTYPSVSLMQQAMAELGRPASELPFFPEPVIRDRTLVRQFRQLHQALELGTSPLERESRLLWFLSHLIDRHSERRSPLPTLSSQPAAVRHTQDYLQQHYQDAVTLKDLAAAVDVSPLKLLRLCKKTWGLPPHRYLIQVRIARAKDLITEGVALSEVATVTGFADQSHLNRHFKRLMGVTPGQYQQGCRRSPGL
ncbi:MAG: AraC family transcriptional regulator [Leptolyngbya sp. SIOISBB]|nr:AraC family transcriptional regulator [Leptolyngbya sp. SIOISBB]